MRIAFIDHYDSFSFNVIDWLTAGPESVDVHYVAYDDAVAMRALLVGGIPSMPLVFSPGPRRPEDARPSLDLLRLGLGRVPILGICLGHQLLAVATGARVGRGLAPWHGTTRTMTVTASPGLLTGLAPSFAAAVYNSLVVDPATLDPAWTINAQCELGEVQAMSRQVPGAAPAFGLQFHPESFLSAGAATIRANWLAVLATGLPVPAAPAACASHA